MEALGCIYLWTNIHNRKKYVGQHSKPDPSDRIKRHITEANKGSKLLLHQAIRKWGIDAFTIDILCICSHSALGNLEEYFAEQHESYKWEHGYNMVWCGKHSTLGLKMPREGVEKQRQALLGRKRSPEAIENVRRGHIGLKRGPETKEKIRQANIGRKHSPETIEKMRQAMYNRKDLSEHLERMRLKCVGKKLSSEHKEKIRQAGLIRWAKKRAEKVVAVHG